MAFVFPAGSFQALKAAVDNGADCVYTGLKDDTNARNFAGLNFGADELEAGAQYAHGHGAKLYLAVNTYPQTTDFERWCRAIDRAAAVRADAVIVADLGLIAYASQR